VVTTFALLFGLTQRREVDTLHVERFSIDLANTEDSAHARMRHLHVVHGIFFGLLERHIDVEDEL